MNGLDYRLERIVSIGAKIIKLSSGEDTKVFCEPYLVSFNSYMHAARKNG